MKPSALPASRTGQWRACWGSRGRVPSRRGLRPTPGRLEFGDRRTSMALSPGAVLILPAFHPRRRPDSDVTFPQILFVLLAGILEQRARVEDERPLVRPRLGVGLRIVNGDRVGE